MANKDEKPNIGPDDFGSFLRIFLPGYIKSVVKECQWARMYADKGDLERQIAI